MWHFYISHRHKYSQFECNIITLFACKGSYLIKQCAIFISSVTSTITLFLWLKKCLENECPSNLILRKFACNNLCCLWHFYISHRNRFWQLFVSNRVLGLQLFHYHYIHWKFCNWTIKMNIIVNSLRVWGCIHNTSFSLQLTTLTNNLECYIPEGWKCLSVTTHSSLLNPFVS